MVKNLINKNKLLYNFLILAVLSVLLIIFSYALIQIRKEVMAEERQLALLKRDYALLDGMLADRDQQKDKIDKVLLSLPQTYMEIGALSYKIENAAAKNNLNASLFFDDEEKEESGKTYVLLTIKIEGGSYQDFSNFASQLTDLPYNFSVGEITYQSKEGKITGEIIIKIYLRK